MDILEDFADSPPVGTTPKTVRSPAVCRTCRWIWLAVIVSLGLWAAVFALLSLLF